MIYAIWYPSGGFGHFVNGILNVYGRNFCRPTNNFSFSNNGNSHALNLVAPSFIKNQPDYQFNFKDNLNYSVVIDNGINDESTNFIKFFPGATIIKLCYSDQSWPIIAHTMIVKASNKTVADVLKVNPGNWNEDSDWARREKYFLFLRDSHLRHMWQEDLNLHCINIETLFCYDTAFNSISNICPGLGRFYDTWCDWFSVNQLYYDPLLKGNEMLTGRWHTLTNIWDQAVFYYLIWCRYGVEVPHNDFSDFFKSQDEYTNWINNVL